MIKGLGTDILEISRLKKVLQKHPHRFISRLFSSKEALYCQKFKDPHIHLAGRFCAKEAISKALGCGFGKELSFKDIEIENDLRGKPTVKFSKKANHHFGNPKIEISISHCNDYATATAIWYSTADFHQK